MERHADYRAVTTGGRDGKEAGVAKAIHAHAQGGSSATIYLDHRAEDRTFDDEPRATGTFTFPPAAENSAAELILPNTNDSTSVAHHNRVGKKIEPPQRPDEARQPLPTRTGTWVPPAEAYLAACEELLGPVDHQDVPDLPRERDGDIADAIDSVGEDEWFERRAQLQSEVLLALHGAGAGGGTI